MWVASVIDRITNTIAVGAVSSPAWLPSLADVSQAAGLLLPIVGLAWLAVQIVFKIWKGR